MTLAVTGGIALITGLLALRTSGVYFLMITLAFGQMIYFTLTSLAAYGGDDGLTLWSLATLFGSDIVQVGEGLYFFIWPCTMLNVMPGRVQSNRVVATGPDSCQVEFDFYYAPGAEGTYTPLPFMRDQLLGQRVDGVAFVAEGSNGGLSHFSAGLLPRPDRLG